MRRALERKDISEIVARRKRIEFATLAVTVCGLIGLGAFASAAIVQGGYFKGILYLGFIILILGVNRWLRVDEFAHQKDFGFRERGFRPMVLLLSTPGEDGLRVRGRFSLTNLLVRSYPDIGLTRVVRERLNRVGPVVSVSDSDFFVTTQFVKEHPLKLMKGMGVSERTLRPAGIDRDELAKGISRQRVERFMRDACLVVMSVGKNGKTAELGGKFSAVTENTLANKGILFFPPVSNRETRARWKDFCDQVYDAAPLRFVLDYELDQAVLFVFRKHAGPLLITAETRDEWAYQVAFDEAIAAKRRDESGTQNEFGGLGGSSTRAG
jgi:hypothetical protein